MDKNRSFINGQLKIVNNMSCLNYILIHFLALYLIKPIILYLCKKGIRPTYYVGTSILLRTEKTHRKILDTASRRSNLGDVCRVSGYLIEF